MSLLINVEGYYGIGAWFSYKLLLVFDYVEVWGQEEVTREAWRDGARNHQVKISKAIRGLGEVNGFERLDKRGMLTRSRSWNRRIADTDWRGIAARVSMGGGAVEVDPRLTSRTCSRCGWVDKDLRGAVFECEACGLRIDGQLNAAVNIYMRMEGVFI